MFQRPNPYDLLPKLPAFAVTSAELEDGAAMRLAQQSRLFGGPGKDESPHLVWSAHPADTKSFVVTCFDADAPTPSGFWHWAVYDIPPHITELAHNAGVAGGAGLPVGAKMLVNDAGLRHFIGGGPPPGTGLHRYYFAVYALDIDTLDITEAASPAWLGFQAGAHGLARGLLVGILAAA